MNDRSDTEVARYWQQLRVHTASRIGLRRVGASLSTKDVLDYRAAHAAAHDAVHEPLDLEGLLQALHEFDPRTAQVVHTRASDRETYLRRPDLGRGLADNAALAPCDARVALVLADGLSPRAIRRHGPPLVGALHDALGSDEMAAPVIALQARVAVGDLIAVAMGVESLVLLIGERPGLSVSDSLGIYVTHRPRAGLTDAKRNCVSNIHPPGGTGYAEAAQLAACLVTGARLLGRSGVDLKVDEAYRTIDERST